MRKSGLTSATLQDLQRRAQQTAGFEVEIEMEMEGEPQEFGDASPQGEKIAPDLPGEPWDHDWEVTEPLLDKPEDNTQRNLGRPMTEPQRDARMVRGVIAESGNLGTALNPFQEVGRGVIDLVMGEMGYEAWAQEVMERLTAQGKDPPEPTDLVWWHEEGYTPDEAVQMAL